MLSYSQIELTDNKGDTLICITYSQMDRIYIELIQKDSLLAQSQISRFKELKYSQIIDSTRKDINALKTYSNDLKSQNEQLYSCNKHLSKLAEERKLKLQRNRKIGLVMLGVIILQALL